MIYIIGMLLLLLISISIQIVLNAILNVFRHYATP